MPEIEIPERETADVLLLVSVSVCAELVVFSVVLEKPTEVGEILNAAVETYS